MIANVTMQISFIGGQGLKEPVARLQNALSFNFFGNTEVYDHRSTATEDRVKFNITELERILKETPRAPSRAETSQSSDAPILGKYIGESAVSGTTLSLNYNSYLLNPTTNIFNITKEYFDSMETTYKDVLKNYSKLILPLVFSPSFKKKYKMDVYNTISTTTEIELFGEYDGNKSFNEYVDGFQTSLIKKLNSLTSISQFLEFDSFLVQYKIERSDDILKPYIEERIKTVMEELKGVSLTGIYENRNKIIDTFDKLNFVMSSNGKDGKLEKSGIVGAQLNDFNPNKFYEKYEKVVKFFQDEHAESFTNNLDTTLDFNRMGNLDITDDVFRDLLGIFLKDKVNEIEKLYTDSADDSFFTRQVVNKIGRKIEKILITPRVRDIRFRAPRLKNTKPVIYSTVIFTLNGTEEDNLKKIHNGEDKSSGTKLNYFRWTNTIIDINFL